jgi:DNA repair protein RadD
MQILDKPPQATGIKQLRPYQENAIALAREAIADDLIPLLIAPTGAGKSPIQLTIANNCIQKGGRALIVVPLQPLISQFQLSAMDWIKDWHKHGISIYAGSQSSSEYELKRSRLCIAMAQTIEHRYGDKSNGVKLPWKPDVIVYDEAHLTVFRDAYTILCKQFPDAQIVPLTATPWRMDGCPFPNNYKWIQVATTRQLIQGLEGKQYLTPYEVYNLCNFKLSKSAKKNQLKADKDYTAQQLEEMLDIATPSKVWQEWQSYRDKHTIAFTPSKKTAQVYADYFISMGQDAIVINDETPNKAREEAYRRFREEKIVLFSVTVLAVGFDQPCATVALLLRPTKSIALLVQMLGRVLRLHPGKDKAYILDFTGTTVADGMVLPADIEDWTQLPTQPGRECPECHYVNGTGQQVCSKCGHEFPIEARERITEENVTNIDVGALYELLEFRRAELKDDRKLMMVRSFGTSEEDNYKAMKQRAYFNNFAPGKAFVEFKKQYDKEPQKEWDLNAIFVDPTFEDVLLYYAYLLMHGNRKGKSDKWVNFLLKQEFGDFLTWKMFKAAVAAIDSLEYS